MRNDTKIRGFVAAGIVVICWSGFNIVSRMGSKGVFTPFDLAAMRFAISGIIAFPFFIYQTPLKEWPRYVVISMIGGVTYSVVVYFAFTMAPAAHAGVFVNGGIPFWTIVMVTIGTRKRIQRSVAIALTFTVGGLLLITSDSLFVAHDSAVWIGDGLFFVAALVWAAFALLMHRWRLPPLRAILGVATFSCLGYMPIYILWLPKTIQAANSVDIIIQCVYQGVIASLFAGWMYSYAIQKIGPYPASMILSLVPGISAVAAYLALGENIVASTIVGVFCVSVGALIGCLPQKVP